MSKVEAIALRHLTPREALEAVDRNVGRTEKVHDEFHDSSEIQSGIVVYEQYFSRVSNRIALVVTAENFNGETRVRIIATGSSQGLIFNLDWGAAGAYVDEVLRILERADREKDK